jgi:hypothetical protein
MLTDILDESVFLQNVGKTSTRLHGVTPERGRAIAQAVIRWFSTFTNRIRISVQVISDFWWTKCLWSRFSPSTPVTLANYHPSSGAGIIGQMGLM